MSNPAPLNLRRFDVEWVPRSKLKAYERNPRLHSPKQIKQIEKSITEFGWTVPILVGRDETVVAGHGRLLAAANLGIAEVPIIRVDHLTEEQQRAYVIADNKLTENGEWDWDLLRKELGELDQTFQGLTGFDEQEITMLEGGDTETDSFKSLFTEDALDSAAQRAIDKADKEDPDAEDDEEQDEEDEPVEITCPHCSKTFTV